MLLNLPTRSLEAFAEAQEHRGTEHQRLGCLQRGKSQIPWMLCTIRNLRQESAAIRFDLGHLPKAVTRQR